MDTRMADSIVGRACCLPLFLVQQATLSLVPYKSVFGPAIFDYYASGKTIPRHAKYGISIMISLMTILSTYGVWAVSTRGDGTILEPSSWNGADPGYGALSILAAGIIGVWYVLARLKDKRLLIDRQLLILFSAPLLITNFLKCSKVLKLKKDFQVKN